MIKQGSGVIINMSSESGSEGPRAERNAASKGTVNLLTRSWARNSVKKEYAWSEPRHHGGHRLANYGGAGIPEGLR